MILGIYSLVWLSGLAAMLAGFALTKHHNESPLLAGVALVCFGALALTGSIQHVEAGETVAIPLAQWIALALGAVNGLAFIAGLLGAWPIENNSDGALSSVGRRTP
jgi:hypothetical protein